MRIRVTHDGGPAAENAEIVVTRLWRVTDGKPEEDTGFLPLSLTWSHYPPPNSTARIPKGLFRHCDFGVFTEAQGKTWLQITTLVQPNPVGRRGYPNVLEPGRYEFELTLSGDNVRPVSKRWSLAFDEEWSNDEQIMLGRVRIAEIE